jgi:pimeloyl-ACP methyl ester carboxylesterase
MRRLGPLLARSIRTRGNEILDLAWHDVSRLTPEIRAGYERPLLVDDWDKALWELTVANNPDHISDRLGEIVIPVLVVTGDDDRIVPTDQSARVAQELPNAQLKVIPETGHLAHEERPGLFLRTVMEFLSELQ